VGKRQGLPQSKTLARIPVTPVLGSGNSSFNVSKAGLAGEEAPKQEPGGEGLGE